jgi:hypothetical protein
MGQFIPPDLLVDFVASTFILVLDWWLASRSALKPAAVNDMFCTLIALILSPTDCARVKPSSLASA